MEKLKAPIPWSLSFLRRYERYDGNVGVANKELGGDVSCVGYKLDYLDPISGGGSLGIPDLCGQALCW